MKVSVFKREKREEGCTEENEIRMERKEYI